MSCHSLLQSMSLSLGVHLCKRHIRLWAPQTQHRAHNVQGRGGPCAHALRCSSSLTCSATAAPASAAPPLTAEQAVPSETPIAGYMLPPQQIIDLVDVPPEPNLSFSPDRRVVLQLYRPPPLPPISELARPELKLAGAPRAAACMLARSGSLSGYLDHAASRNRESAPGLSHAIIITSLVKGDKHPGSNTLCIVTAHAEAAGMAACWQGSGSTRS